MQHIPKSAFLARRRVMYQFKLKTSFKIDNRVIQKNIRVNRRQKSTGDTFVSLSIFYQGVVEEILNDDVLAIEE